MDWQDFWKLLHLLTFVYWVGADLGVFYSARVVCNSSYQLKTRITILGILSWIDMIPRYMLILTFPVGFILLSYVSIDAPNYFLIIFFSFLAVLWIVVSTIIHIYGGTSFGKKLVFFDFICRVAFILALLSYGLLYFFGAEVNIENWAAIKIILFAGTVFCGLGIRVTFKPFTSAFKTLVNEGSNPEVEATMKRSLNHAVPFVLGIWVLAGIAAFIGLTHEVIFLS